MSNHPPFLLNNPAPQIKQRLYNGRKLVVFEGQVKISSIVGWVDNPRIELAKRKMQDLIGSRELTQDEILELMKTDPDVELKKLRDDILKNGLREPLTISFHGKLLDGNRRFFAIQYALAEMPATNPNRQDLETVDVYVLTSASTEEDEQNVLVEENFSASLKIEWPEYVKASRVIEAKENGLSPEQISKKFRWPKSKITETIKIHDLISEFRTFATGALDLEDPLGGGLGLSEQEAEMLAAKNYQFFNEAQKSFYNPLQTDIEFKLQFFKWLFEKKFASFQEVRVAYTAWKNPEAKAALMQPEPTAAKSAKAIIDYNARITHTTEEAAGRIDTFVNFLKKMTADEISRVPRITQENLKKALELVIKMSEAASGK